MQHSFIAKNNLKYLRFHYIMQSDFVNCIFKINQKMFHCIISKDNFYGKKNRAWMYFRKKDAFRIF